MNRNRLPCSIWRSLAFSLLLLLVVTAGAFADVGDQSGSGSGQNSDIPLTLLSSVPGDSASDVLLDTTIELYFNKNICNVSVLENNRTCFHLTSEAGEVIPVTLTFPDDQVQQTYKRDVFLTPKESLQPDTRYRVAVDRTLTAKNGTTIDNAHVFEFVTGEGTGAELPAELAALGELGIRTFDSALPETEDSVPLPQESVTQAAGSEPAGGQTSSFCTLVIILLSVCTILGILILSTVLRLRKRRLRV